MTFVPNDHPEARAEYLNAVTYYDDLRAGLGEELIDRFEDAIREILHAPDSWPLVREWDEQPALRSHRVETFRYRVVYYVRDAEVRIVAYAHTSRAPGYWAHRIEG